ncbi:unnamed protein product [Cuscuta epithymum]|uniref:Uncharacterized protein n=1 Tax=Cuscuta epithymum TaxID=186058 RepID=A0AAV0DLH5_9ASTE|nr:unnamed protein product [Cuscuta epithymum]
MREARGAVLAGGARDPDEVAAGVGHEEEALRRSAEVELDEVLAGAGRRAGDEGQLSAAAIEGNEAGGVGGEGVRGGGREGVVTVERELEILEGGFSGGNGRG